MNCIKTTFLLACTVFISQSAGATEFEENNGYICFEAEHFAQNEGSLVVASKDDVAKLAVVTSSQKGKIAAGWSSVSGGALVQVSDQNKKLYYDIIVHTPGEWVFAVKNFNPSLQLNGFYLQLDGQGGNGKIKTLHTYEEWYWRSVFKTTTGQDQPSVVAAPFLANMSAGKHRLAIFDKPNGGIESDRNIIDKVVLMTKAYYDKLDTSNIWSRRDHTMMTLKFDRAETVAGTVAVKPFQITPSQFDVLHAARRAFTIDGRSLALERKGTSAKNLVIIRSTRGYCTKELTR